MNYLLKDINESYTQLITDDRNFKFKCLSFLSPEAENFQFDPRFRRGLWNGRKELFTIINKNIQFPKGLVEYIIKALNDDNLEFTYEKSTENTDITEKDFKEFLETLNLPFPPYDYQLSCAYDMIKYKRGLFDACTSCLDPNTKIKCLVSEEVFNRINS